VVLCSVLGTFFKDFSDDQVVARSLFWIVLRILYDFLTSLIRIFFIGKAIWCGAFKSLLMGPSSFTDSWDGKGRKTEARCSAEAVASSLSVLAQVLWFIRIGGMWC